MVLACPNCTVTVRKARRIPISPPESKQTPELDPRPPYRPPTLPTDQHPPTPTPTPILERTPPPSVPKPAPNLPVYDDGLIPVPLSPARPGGRGHPGSPARASSIFSATGSEGKRRNIFGFLRPKEPKLDLLPENLIFTFSATGQSILLWRLNGHSLSRIQVKDRTSSSLPLRNALQAFDGDRTVTIKLVHEGKESMAIILDNKQVCLCH
jgi:hypothetical protein